MAKMKEPSRKVLAYLQAAGVGVKFTHAQVQKDREFDRCKDQFASVEPRPVRLAVNGEPADRQLRRRILRPAAHVVAGVPAQLRLHARHELQGIERLGNVVVCPQGQAGDLVGVLYFGREEDHGKIVPAPDLPQQRKPVPVRQHDVKNSEGNILPLHCVEHTLRPIEFQDFIALVLKIDLNQICDLLFVIRDKNLHPYFTPLCAVPRVL